jgi:HEAT repeat protein
MADATSKRLLELLDPESATELRRAAAVILGEVGGKDQAVARALTAALDDADANVRLEALRAVGKLRVDAALPKLLERISQGGPESEVAADAAAGLGARGTKGLRELMGKTAPGLRRRIAAALAGAGTDSAEAAALDALLDSDPGVVDASTRTLIDKIPTLSSAHRRSLADQIIALLKPSKKSPLSRVSEVALVRLLARLADPRGEAVFWARIDPASPPELRSAALDALGTLEAPSNPDKIKRLLACAAHADFRVVAPALMILKTVPAGDRMLKDWLALLQAPDPGARQFAVEKLGEKDRPEVAAALVPQLQHPDPNLRKEALARLAKLDHGRTALTGALLKAANPDEAWTLARAQMPFAKEYSKALQSKILAHACAYLEKGDRRADPLLTLLREADARNLRDRLEERALALRKKKKYEEAHTYFRLLTRDPACGEAIRFEHGASALKLSSHDLAAESRASDPALHQFAGLIHRHETEPIVFVEKAKWLEPEDLFYLGFHFAEGKGPEQEFGAKVLRLLIKRSAKGKFAKDARSKLRSQGLAEK